MSGALDAERPKDRIDRVSAELNRVSACQIKATPFPAAVDC